MKNIYLTTTLLALMTTVTFAKPVTNSFTFTEYIEPRCGIEVTSSEGGIKFSDTTTEPRKADFKIISNLQTSMKAKFSNITQSSSIESSDLNFDINGQEIRVEGNETKEFTVTKNTENYVFVKTSANTNDLPEGNVSIQSTLVLDCSVAN